MKKIIFGAALSVLCLACSQDEKEFTNPVQTTTAQFGWRMVSSGDMTRAVTTGEALAQIRALLPTNEELNRTGITLLEHSTSQDVNVNLGATYTLRTGDYTCQYEYKRNGLSYTGYTLNAFPTFTIDYTFTITPETQYYSLPAQYTCAALVWDATECELSVNDLPLNATAQTSADGTRVIFVYGYTDDTALTLTLTPVDTEEHRLTQCAITGADLQLGHYYRLAPQPAKTSAGVTLTLDDFTEGTL